MNAVANMFDRNGEGYIDWKEFLAALRPDWEEPGPPTEAEKINDEVKRAVQSCTCRNRFKVHQVGEGKYRVCYFITLLHLGFIWLEITDRNNHFINIFSFNGVIF